MARQKKPVHRVQMTDGKEMSLDNCLKSMISKQQRYPGCS